MKKGVKKKSNFSNRLSYTIIAVLAILLVSVSVYAYGTSSPSTFGHSISEIDPPQYCGGTGYNEGYLVYQNGWKCADAITSIGDTGYERVSTSGTGTFVDAFCPSGKKVIGGGCSTGLSLTSSYPYPAANGGAYKCVVSSNPSSLSITAYAICVY